MNKIKYVTNEFFSHEGILFRASLSYGFLLTLFPSLIIMVILFQYGILDYITSTQFIYNYFPADVIQPFIEFVMLQDYSNILTVFLTIGAVSFLASRSFYSFLLISANHEEFETYAFVIRLKAIVVFIAFIAGILIVSMWSHIFNTRVGFTVPIGMFTLFYFLFRVLSFEKRPWQYGLLGSFVTTIGIGIIGLLFLSLIHTFTRYDTFYGPLSSILILLISTHFIASVIYLGYCINHAFDYHLPNKEYKNAFIYRFFNSFGRRFK